MKTISTLLFIVWSHTIVLGQSSSTVTASGHCSLDYTDGKWVMFHKEASAHVCNSVFIKSMPPLTQPYTLVNMNINIKGVYMLRKDPSLELPEDYTIELEDLLTGQYYNLSSPEPYTYNLNRASNEARFALEIKKNSQKNNGNSTAALHLK